MKKEKICGIYKITSPSGKIYVGSSKNIHRRHLEYKNLNCEYQFKLYNSLVKYGFENHVIEIIEECPITDLNCRERYWQDFYDVLSRNGLNLTLQECGDKRRVFSKEAKRTIGERQKGGKNPSAVKVINVNTLEEYDCLKCLAEELGVHPTSLGSKLRGHVTNDTPFIHKKNYEDFLKGNYTNVNIFKERRKAWDIVNRETNEIFNNLKKAIEPYGDLKYSTVLGWLRNPNANNSPFIYLKDYNPYEEYVYEPKNKSTTKRKVIDTSTFIIYPSCKKASDVLGINNTTFSTRIKYSSNKTTFKFLEDFLKDNPDFDTSLFIYYEK